MVKARPVHRAEPDNARPRALVVISRDRVVLLLPGRVPEEELNFLRDGAEFRFFRVIRDHLVRVEKNFSNFSCNVPSSGSSGLSETTFSRMMIVYV